MEVVCLLFEGILELWLVFATPKLAPFCGMSDEGWDEESQVGILFLSGQMFRINLHAIFFLELADESRIP